jgi:alpha-glucosidase
MFAREGLTCIVNLTADAIDLPEYSEILLTSSPLDEDRLPSDTTAWLR